MDTFTVAQDDGVLSLEASTGDGASVSEGASPDHALAATIASANPHGVSRTRPKAEGDKASKSLAADVDGVGSSCSHAARLSRKAIVIKET